MDDLTAFLNARLDEDEAAAKAADGGPWTSSGPYLDAPGTGIIMQARHSEDAAHAARHDPARVLREVEAKRAIVARYGSLPSVTNLGEHLQRSQEQAGLSYAIRLLAAIWDDHPDYRPEWKP